MSGTSEREGHVSSFALPTAGRCAVAVFFVFSLIV